MKAGRKVATSVLKNIMGLWLLQRVLQSNVRLPALIAATQALPACRFIINQRSALLNLGRCAKFRLRVETAQPIGK